MISFSCSVCGKAWKVDERFAGQTVACPGCQSKVAVPANGVVAGASSLSSVGVPSTQRPLWQWGVVIFAAVFLALLAANEVNFQIIQWRMKGLMQANVENMQKALQNVPARNK